MRTFIPVVMFVTLLVSLAYIIAGPDAWHSESTPPDVTLTQPILKKATELSDANAQYNQGRMYEKSKDYNQAVLWYRNAATQGLAVAQYRLGIMYNDGTGVVQDYNQAVLWYRKAAEQGLAAAQYNLAHIYYGPPKEDPRGIADYPGVARDYNQEMLWFRKAAEQGCADAQFMLGGEYMSSRRVTQDYNQGFLWLRKAADQDNESAQIILANDFLKAYEATGVYHYLNQATLWSKRAEQSMKNNLPHIGCEKTDLIKAASQVQPITPEQPVQYKSEPNSNVEVPQENVQQAPENNQTSQENAELSRYKAKDRLEEANKQINIVWNTGTKDIRLAILPEQREWLSKRENDCTIKASLKEPNNDIAYGTLKLSCMSAMTLERTEVLRQKIAHLQKPNNKQAQNKNGLHYSEEELSALAEDGDSNAMYALGYRYLKGIGGVPKGTKLAMEWFKESADAGNRRAIELLK